MPAVGRDGSFDAFVQAASNAPIAVQQLAPVAGHPGRFDKSYASPTQGAMTFGWNTPFAVNGATIALHGTKRYDNPYVTAPVGAQRYAIRIDGSELTLDFSTNRRGATSRR